MPKFPLSSCRIRQQIKILIYISSILFLIVAASRCSNLIQASFVDSSSLKPSIILILPQSFKVPTNQIQVDAGNIEPQTKLQQYVAIINTVQNERDDQLIREQYKKLTLQVRDAKSPVTGQLFYEYIFDYFPPNSLNKQKLLIPINLDQVSFTLDQLVNAPTKSLESTIIGRPQQLIVSIRPYKLDSGFGSDSIEFVSSIPVPVEPIPSSDGRRSFGVVQTDKPVYKPEDKVRIRSLVVNENLRPVVKDELCLQIKNPHKVIVEEIRFPNNGNNDWEMLNSSSNSNKSLYLDHVFEFPPEPMLGTWSVHLLHNDPIANDTTSFEVKEYILPTFEIAFESPKYILPNTKNITGYIVAKYHHGKPVQGKAQFKFGYKEFGAAKPRFIARSSIKNVDPTTGRIDYRISSEKFKETDWFPMIAGSRLIVEATVTETATGHSEIAQDTSCSFITLPYRITFEDSIEDFKPGLSQQLTVQVLEMQTQRPAPANIRLTAQYWDQNSTILIDTIGDNFRQRLDVEAYTNSLGRATFNIGPIRDDITSIRITIKWLNSTTHQSNDNKSTESSQSTQQIDRLRQTSGQSMLNELAIGHHTLSKHESFNGWISIINKSTTHLNVGDRFVSDLFIRDAVVIPQMIFYIIVARGQILAFDNLDSEGLIKFTIREEMIPSIRLVLFAITHDSIGLLSDSMRINVGQDLNCGLTVRYISNNAPTSSVAEANATSTTTTQQVSFRPNDKGKLIIKARYGDLVSLIGVDSAVYTLNNRAKLDSSRIMQRIRRLDSGCGFGGGKNNLDVFHNAGLMLFKENVVSNIQSDTASAQLGSSCSTLLNQLKHLEDIQLGYTRPMFSAATLLSRPRALELAVAVRQKMISSSTAINAAEQLRHSRNKREVDVESILKRYKDPMYRTCCRLGTLEDLPQRRNCSVRARIVEKYMQQVEFHCSKIYLDCCRAVFGEQLLLSSMLSARDQAPEPIIENRIFRGLQATQANEPILLPYSNYVGHLDSMEMQTFIRKDFRETWLFELVNIYEADGSAPLEVQLPHSITTWSISAMALNLHQPMCIMSKPLELTTFQEIFLHVSMPYKVIQGEQIDLVATVFNYSPFGREILVYMYGVEDVCSEAEPGERSNIKRIRIGKHASQSLLFPIIPLKTGKYAIKILAITSTSDGSDIVERYLNVVPRGKPVTDETTFSLDPMNQQRRSKRAIQTGNLMDEIDSSKGLQRSKVRLTPTRDSEYIVPLTQECIVSAIGDKMGQSVQTTMIDVENLIRLPHGCGEQVMIYLGPTLYTARYLSSINKFSGDLRWRAIRYIQSGYKRILNYRNEHGAFSAFPRRDPSIWLTAFIAKMLCQTERTPYIAEEIHVDKTVINSALNWLVDIQNKETGTWVELNPVYHREMLGGVLKENALTAFVTISLSECAHHSPDLIDETETKDATERHESTIDFNHAQTNGIDKLKVSTQKAEQALMLDRYKATKERNPYVLALTAYALSLSRPRDAVELLNDLLLIAERSQSRNQLYWRGDYPIETAAYALQALIELAPIVSQPTGILTLSPATSSIGSSLTRSSGTLAGADALAIANWLTTRRSYTGAFESTQDTVVALEALSKFAQLQSAPNGNSLVPESPSSPPSLMCNVTMSNRTRRSIEFGKDNAQILQTFKLESFDIDTVNGEMLDIVTSGNGLGTMSVKLKYNVFQEEDELCRFNIDSSIEEWRPKITLSTTTATTTNSHNNQAEGESHQVMRDNTMKKEGINNNPSDETIEDDYFKTFDKSMLSELNLIDPNYSDSTNVKPISVNIQKQKHHLHAGARREILRLKRYASKMLNLSMNNSSQSMQQESWTSKLVSSLKAKLPSWLTPRETAVANAAKIAMTITPIPSTTSLPNAYISNYTTTAALRRTNTSRRSAQSSPIIPMIVRPTAITDIDVNSLSKQLDANSNETIGQIAIISSSSQQQTLGNQLSSSNRLVLLLRVCVHHMSSRRDSEMAVIELGILSGFKPNEADLKEIINKPGTPAMKYELSADRSLVIIYMQYIPFTGPYCFQFRLVRDSLVHNLQSGYIRVYEYYSPAHSCSNFYTPTRQTDLIETKCDSSGQVCQCAAKSLCPATKKLLDLGEIHSLNTTRARDQLMKLVCSDRFDFVSLVRLKSVRHLEAGKMFKLLVKVKSDLKGNIIKIMDAQNKQKVQFSNSVRKPQYTPLALKSPSISANNNNSSIEVEPLSGGLDDSDDMDSSLDYLNLSIDTGCVRNDPFLLHLAHPNQRKQGGELMILFGRYSNLEKRYFRTTAKSSIRHHQSSYLNYKPGLISSGQTSKSADQTASGSIQEAQMTPALFEDAQQLQYSTTMLLDKGSILYDISYQAKVEPRATINNLILWLELRSRREKWTCHPEIQSN